MNLKALLLGTACIVGGLSLHANPEIDLSGNGIPIADGDTMTTTVAGTDFGGTAVLGGVQVHTFSIQNSGTTDLTVSAIQTSGFFAPNYTVGGITLPVVIAAGGNSAFTLTFDPSARGDRPVTVTILNDDADEATYDFGVTGKGGDWETVVADSGGANNVGLHSSLAIVDGFPAIAHYDFTDRDLRYVRATNADGTAWAPPTIVQSINLVGEFPALVVANGRPVIGYSNFTGSDLRSIRANDSTGGSWANPVVIDSALTNDPRDMSIAIVNGNPAIAYFDSSGLDLKYVRAANPDGTAWNAPVTIASTGDVGRFASLVVVNGRPAIAYWDFTGAKLRYVRANDANGGSWGAVVTPDNASSFVGSDCSLAVVNGRPAISYRAYSQSVQDLKYVRANDADGAAWGSPVTVESAGDNGLWSSLAVVNGLPAISHGRDGGFALHFNLANDPDGTSWGSTVNADRFGSTVGKMSCLAVVNGRPAISHLAEFDGDLRYSRFNDTAVTGAPEIDLTGNVMSIASGDMTPGPDDLTEFEDTGIGFSFQRSFVIRNHGTTELRVNSFQITGAHAGDFAVSAPIPPRLVAPASALVVQVLFTPSAVGLRSAVLSIDNSDADESPYVFAIQGTGLPGAEIVIRDGPLATDPIIPNGGGPIDFGASRWPNSSLRMFRIENNGPTDLMISSWGITPSSSNWGTGGLFAPTTVPAGGSKTMNVGFGAVTPGVDTQVLFVNNSSGTAPQYSFEITGLGLSALEAWRQSWFSAYENTGDAADSFDFDFDGLVNLLEFAFDLDPTVPEPFHFPGSIVGPDFVVAFESSPWVDGVVYGVEWSATLQPDDWQSLPELGTGNSHEFRLPLAGRPVAFFRISVTVQ